MSVEIQDRRLWDADWLPMEPEEKLEALRETVLEIAQVVRNLKDWKDS